MRDGIRVCYRYKILAWRHDNEGIATDLVEDSMFVGPSPVWDRESVGLVSAIFYGVILLAMRVGDSTYSVQVVHELGNVFLMMGTQIT